MENIMLPDITGSTTDEQLLQVKNYLHEMVSHLNYVISNFENSAASDRQVQQRILNGMKPDANAPGETFNSIKSLIIKSADIVDAFYNTINNRLSGSYVAQSAFGTYREETDQKIAENAEGISRNFSTLMEISDAVNEIDNQMAQVNAYIRTGKLFDDDTGIPVFGVEIGQQNTTDGVVSFKKYARLTSGKLSFYDENDNEVAYISERQLHISSADVGYLDCTMIRALQFGIGDYMWSIGSDGHLTLT